MLDIKLTLDLHAKWLKNEEGGKRANLTRANLTSANLTSANLTSANLTSANLTSANLTSADLYGANLTSANLTSADLIRANLTRANLTSANLTSANLTSADLYCANLTSANLTSADLIRANLTRANLTSANLTSANLYGANLTSANLTSADLIKIKEDFLRRLALARNEIPALLETLKAGKVNGSVYEGECACFCGTIANIRKEPFKEMGIDLRPDPTSATERWFLAIQKGHTPENNQIAKITADWIEEFLTAIPAADDAGNEGE